MNDKDRDQRKLMAQVYQDAMDEVSPSHPVVQKMSKDEAIWDAMGRSAPAGERCWNCQNFNGERIPCKALYGYTTSGAHCAQYTQLRGPRA